MLKSNPIFTILFYSFYFCSQGIKTLINILVSPVYLINILNNTRAFSTQSGNKQSHSRSYIGGVHFYPFQSMLTLQPDYYCPMRIAEYNTCPHFNKLIHKEKTAFKHFLRSEERR